LEIQQTTAKDKIISASYELFKERDYNTIRITDITRRASVTKATFYNNFQNKMDLLVMLSEEKIEDAVRSTYDGQNYGKLQRALFTLEDSHKAFFAGIDASPKGEEYWMSMHIYLCKLLENIKMHNNDSKSLQKTVSLTIDTYVNSAIYLFRHQLQPDMAVPYNYIAQVLDTYLPGEYKTVTDVINPASIMLGSESA